MSKLCIVPTQNQEVKNIAYPANRPRGIWQSITHMLANIFFTHKRAKRSNDGSCITCIYWKDWKCLKHKIEKAATGPRCNEFADVNSIPLSAVVAIRKELEQ